MNKISLDFVKFLINLKKEFSCISLKDRAGISKYLKKFDYIKK